MGENRGKRSVDSIKRTHINESFQGKTELYAGAYTYIYAHPVPLRHQCVFALVLFASADRNTDREKEKERGKGKWNRVENPGAMDCEKNCTPFFSPSSSCHQMFQNVHLRNDL